MEARLFLKRKLYWRRILERWPIIAYCAITPIVAIMLPRWCVLIPLVLFLSWMLVWFHPKYK